VNAVNQTYNYHVNTSPVSAPPAITGDPNSPSAPKHSNGANGVLVCKYDLSVVNNTFDPAVLNCPNGPKTCDNGFRNHLWVKQPAAGNNPYLHIETQTLTPAPGNPQVPESPYVPLLLLTGLALVGVRLIDPLRRRMGVQEA
jgi:hypothetical protein